MSWYIQLLTKNKIEIKSKADLESDEYNDLLVIEKKINDLYNAGIISEQEMLLLEYVEDGKPMANSKEGFGKNRISLANDFENLCSKIAFYMGGYFTDDGYANYMCEKYNLTDEQVERMITYMKSKYKNKLLRKQKKNKNVN
jgi:hypothetical protein